METSDIFLYSFLLGFIVGTFIGTLLVLISTNVDRKRKKKVEELKDDLIKSSIHTFRVLNFKTNDIDKTSKGNIKYCLFLWEEIKRFNTN